MQNRIRKGKTVVDCNETLANSRFINGSNDGNFKSPLSSFNPEVLRDLSIVAKFGNSAGVEVEESISNDSANQVRAKTSKYMLDNQEGNNNNDEDGFTKVLSKSQKKHQRKKQAQATQQ